MDKNKINSNDIIKEDAQMKQFRILRANRFPRGPNEIIDNKFDIGHWLEVQHTQTNQWKPSTVVDKQNNWIVTRFEKLYSKYNQQIHIFRDKKRFRNLGSDIPESQEEKNIREQMNNFLCEVEKFNWKLIEVDGDGNCLYRCFAINIYNDTTKHM
eukprot:456934_1